MDSEFAHLYNLSSCGEKIQSLKVKWYFCRRQVLMHGRGRGVAGAMGRGRLMPNKQNLRVVECKPQPCVVSVEGLSSSTTDVQLKNLLMSVGPIQVGCLGPAPGLCCPDSQSLCVACFMLKWHVQEERHVFY